MSIFILSTVYFGLFFAMVFLGFVCKKEEEEPTPEPEPEPEPDPEPD
ncbi:MAG: hypothetical protein ACXADL_05785 [Candidatus Thorarchaeota archaeon]|jgi:hypothetical protein